MHMKLWATGRVVLAFTVLGLAMGAGSLRAREIRRGETLIRAMHDRSQGRWYDTLTFTQKSITYNPDGTSSSEIWHEAAWLPGKLRIDIGPVSNGNGFLLSDGALTSFKDGKAVRTAPLVHMLMVLGFDVYAQDPQTTLDQIRNQGFDLTKLHEDTWQDEPAYVVGADKGDSRSKQVWISKNRLWLLRLIEPNRQDASKNSDTRFVDYRQLPVGWVAAQVEVYVEGKKVFGEEYSDIRSNPKLDPAIFDAKQFSARHWEE